MSFFSMFSRLTTVFILSVIAIQLFGEEPVPPGFVKSILPLLSSKDEITKLRGNRVALSPERQAALIDYFKKLNSKEPKELALKIRLLPYLASVLSFDNFSSLLKYCFFKEPEYYRTPSSLRYAFLAELGYMALKEKSTSGRAYKFLVEMSKMQDSKRFIYSRVFSFNSRILARIGSFTRMYKLFISDVDKDKKTREFLFACMENNLADNQRPLFIYKYRTPKEVKLEDPKVLVFGPFTPPPPKPKISDKQGMMWDSCIEDSQNFFLMLADMLDYPDPKVRLEAARRLRSETGQNFGYNPVGTPAERKAVSEQWREYLSKHDVLKERYKRHHREAVRRFKLRKRKRKEERK